MATKDIKVLTDDEKKVIASALRVQQKSHLRASNGAANPVIADEFKRLAVQCQSLANHFEYGQVDLG